MIQRLNNLRFKSRTPLLIRRRNGTVYFQTQIEVARTDGFRSGIYYEYDKIDTNKSCFEIGNIALKSLKRFDELSDMTENGFYNLTGLNMSSYEEKADIERLRYMGANDFQELSLEYEECSIHFDMNNKTYSFSISWLYKKGKQCFRDECLSTGEKGILTFDKPLEFDYDIAPEQLGEMILEAFDRSRKMAEAKSTGKCPPKAIELFEGTIVEVIPPQDKHFSDFDDAGVGEIYQDYAYITKDGADSSADILLTVAPELYNDLSCDNIRSAWKEAFGEEEELNVVKIEHGIFKYRAVFKNKKMYRIAYFCELNDRSALECCLEITNPTKKKKITEMLPPLFEEFAIKCKIKK